MNARRALRSGTGPIIHYVDFNDDKKYFCVALEDGFAMFKTDPCELYARETLPGSIGLATMLGSTAIFGLISGGDRPQHDSRRLTLYNLTKQSEVATIKTVNPIIRARLSSTRIALIFERSVALYKHKDSIEKLSTYETASNPLGLCCLGSKVMIVPGRSAGQLQIIDIQKLDVQIVPAHSSTLRAIELSPNEEIVASASDKGTLIRIHSTLTTARLAELRRGITEATVLSLAISPSNDRLALTSDTNTLHIFDLPASTSSRLSHPHGQSTSRSPTPEGASASARSGPGAGIGPSHNKYPTLLTRLPFAPRLLTDTYSTASCPFSSSSSSTSQETLTVPGAPFEKDTSGRWYAPGRYTSTNDEEGFVDIVPGVPGGSPSRGVCAWIDGGRVVVVGGGRGGRLERFLVQEDGRGGVGVGREGWCELGGLL